MRAFEDLTHLRLFVVRAFAPLTHLRLSIPPFGVDIQKEEATPRTACARDRMDPKRTTNRQIQIQYIYNSCYTIDFDDTFIVIDYYTGDLELPKDKKILFFVTHGHGDHYSPEIFQLPGAQDAHYLISSDVREVEKEDNVIQLGKSTAEVEAKKHAYDAERVRIVDPGDHFTWNDIDYRIFGSTDRGVSIWFQMHGVTFFHSGDLNAWTWPSSTAEVQAQEKADFMKQIELIKAFPIDIGFGVVDARLEGNAFEGGELYLKYLQPQLFFPLHFRDKPEITVAFAKYMEGKTKTNVQVIRNQYDTVTVQL